MAFVDMNNLNVFKNTVYIHGTNDKIASAYLGAIDNTPRYDDSTFDYRVYLTKSLAQTTSLDESLFSLEYLYKNKIDAILTDTFKIDVLFDTNRSIKDIYTDLDKVYLNNSIGIFDLSTCFYTTPLAKQIPLFTTIEQETLDDFFKNNDIFKDIENDENLFNEVISNIKDINKIPNVDEFYTYIKTNYLKHYKLNKIINTIYFNLINDLVNKYNENINSYLTFYDFTTKFGITSDKYNASKIVDLYNYIIKMQELISFTLSNHTKIEEGMEIIEKLDEKFPVPDENKYKLAWNNSNLLDFEVNLYSPNDDIVIAGSDRSNKGIYYSEDNGKTWNRSNITEGNFYHFKYFYNETKKVIVAGGMTNEGIYYSEDNGKTWNQSNISSDSVYEFGIIHNTLVVSLYGINDAKGIYYSIDFGKTWNPSNIISEKCKSFINSEDYIIVSSETKGIYKSEDDGKTWNLIQPQPLPIEKNSFYSLMVMDSTVIAGSNSKGLYYSEDNGKTWTSSNIQSNVFICLTVIGSTVIAGSNSDDGLYYSEDNGKTWNQSNISTDSFYSLTVIGSTVIAGSSSGKGLYYSEDNGKTWFRSNVGSDTFLCLTVIGSTVIAGSGSNGLYYSEDNGKTWNRSNISSGNFRCLTVIGSTVIAGSNSSKGLYYSEDNGKTWNRSNISTNNFNCLTVIGSTVIAGSNSKGLYYSEDNGKTWTSSNITFNDFSCLTVIGSTVIAGSNSNKGLYYSEDNGKTWNQSNIQSDKFWSLIVIDSTVIAGSNSSKGLYYSEDNGKIWKPATTMSLWFESFIKTDKTIITTSNSNKGICYSENNGASWIQSNIKEGNFVALSSIDNHVVAGGNSDQGLYYSEDNGKTWNQSNITSSDFSHIIALNNMFVAASSSLDGVYYSNDFGKTWTEFVEFYSYTNSLIAHNGSALICIIDSNVEEPRSVVKYSELVESKLEFKGKSVPNLYNVLWSITDSRLSKLTTIKENTEMYNYFSKELINNNITEELNKFMILGKDIIHPLLESSKNGSLSMDENQIDKVYSVLTENYCKIKCLINSLKNNEINLEELPNNNEFIVYLYISAFILMTLSVISSSSSKNKVFEVVDFDTIMQVLGIDYQKVYNEEDILNFISQEMNK